LWKAILFMHSPRDKPREGGVAGMAEHKF
jgi:hypothetical protein